MPTSSLPSSPTGQDPVAHLIETCLQDLQAHGMGQLQRVDGHGGVHVRFGDHTAYAENYDIALVRLAGGMLEESRYRPALMSVLRDSLQSAT